MEIKVKYIDGLEDIIQAHPGEWFDLRSADYIRLYPYQYYKIPLGVAMELPEGYEAHILPRSSTFEQFGIIPVNGMSVIDNTYHGDNDFWSFPVLSVRLGYIQKNDRICQFRLMPTQPEVSFKKVDKLDNEDRKGFGSSGKR